MNAAAVTLRRCFCSFTTTAATTSPPPPASPKKKPLVFLGSPQVSTKVLDALLAASESDNSIFKLAAIVTQPPSQRERGRKLMPSPVAQYALDRGFPDDLILTPERAGEEVFLSSLKSLQPELCITAAYGNILPSKFLKIPTKGTVNIHPSLLPLYRGAAPVQRALQDGVKETGVSLAFTIRALDAGPIIAWERFPVDDHIKVRAFAGWPGTRAKVLVIDPGNDSRSILEMKVISTRISDAQGSPRNEPDDVTFSKGAIIFPCGENTELEVLEVQLPGKKVVNAAAFWNGLRGRNLKKL